MHNALLSLAEEEQAKGLVGLGIVAPMPPKDERKAIKRMKTAKAKTLDSRKFKKAVTKQGKAVIKWWHKFEQRVSAGLGMFYTLGSVLPFASLTLACAVQRKEHIDEATGEVWAWFHGLLSRQDAENLLFDAEDKQFLLRLSDRTNNYALSLRVGGRYRHYRVVHSPAVSFDGARQCTP